MGVAEVDDLRTWWTKTARIREKFPNPTRTYTGGAYCVGGAFLKYHALNGGFPGSNDIAKGLVKVNPNLPWDRANIYATSIIRLNDAGDFCGAWETLERALTY